MSVKRQLTQPLATQFQSPEQLTPYRNELGTIGMRIRKAISDGYQTPDNLLTQVYHHQLEEEEQRQNNSVFSRTPLPSNVIAPPLLTNATSTMSTYGSNLEEWEANLGMRLDTIEEKMAHQAISKRRFDCVDNDW